MKPKENRYMSLRKAARIAQAEDDRREHLSRCPADCDCGCAACRSLRSRND